MKTSIAFIFLAPAALATGCAYAIGQPLSEALLMGVALGLVCVVLFMCLFESAPTVARGEFLDALSHNFCIAREFYGDLKEMPNDHCYYDRYAEFPGWYESDNALRDRIKKALSNA